MFSADIYIDSTEAKYCVELTEDYEGDKYHLAVFDMSTSPPEHFQTIGCDTAKAVFEYLNKLQLIDSSPRRIKTEDGYTFYILPNGKVVDNLIPDLVDMTYDSIDDLSAAVTWVDEDGKIGNFQNLSSSPYCQAVIDYLDDEGIDTESYKTLYSDLIATAPSKRNWKKLQSQLQDSLPSYPSNQSINR